MDMLTKVAMAIDPLAWVIPDEDYPAERSRRGAKQFAAMSAARRAIEALREPTEEMIEKGSDARRPGNSRWGNSHGTWKSMIDAALK